MPSDTPSAATPPAATAPSDLLPVREASRLVDRGVSTLRGWIRDGALTRYLEDPTHPENSRVLVSRAELLTLAVTAKLASHPGRPSASTVDAPASPELQLPAGGGAELERLRSTLAELRADVRATLAERDGARAALEATGRTVDVLEARCRDLAAMVDAERRRASELQDRLTAAEAERDSLRELHRLPWYRRLLGGPTTPRLTGGGGGDA